MFKNRTDAGHRLALRIADDDCNADIVLAIPRGGLPIGSAVADHLRLPLDIVAARKIGVPWNRELAIGAVASDGTVWLNESLIEDLEIKDAYIDERIEVERDGALEKIEHYRGDRPPLELSEKTVLLVDDGVATGATMFACLRQIRSAGAARVIVAVPVAPPDTVSRLEAEADEVICLESPRRFMAVGQFYQSFNQVSDTEAKTYLEKVESNEP